MWPTYLLSGVHQGDWDIIINDCLIMHWIELCQELSLIMVCSEQMRPQTSYFLYISQWDDITSFSLVATNKDKTAILTTMWNQNKEYVQHKSVVTNHKLKKKYIIYKKSDNDVQALNSSFSIRKLFTFCRLYSHL